MRVLFSALVVLVCAPSLRAQDANVDVIFDRSTSEEEAVRSVFRIVPGTMIRGGDRFPPLYVGAEIEAPLSGEVMAALFASGAMSVKVTRSAAQLVATGLETDVSRVEGWFPGGGYLVTVGYASTVTTSAASEAFASAVGVQPSSVRKEENVLRLSVPSASMAALSDQLPNVSGVVAVRVER